MAESVDRAASSSPAHEAVEPDGSPPLGPKDGESGHEHEAKDADGREEEAEEPQDARSLTELLEQLGRDVSALGVSEAQLEAARNMPEVRRAARDVAGTLVVAIAALTAFAFINVAAIDGLSKALATWLAALVLAAAWIAVAGVLLFGFLGRVRRWLSWIVFTAPPTEAVKELERDRDAAGQAVLRTLEELGPVLAAQVALAAVPDAGEVASGVIEVGDDVLEGVDEIVEEFTEQLPGGGVVNQVWDVVLIPGRFGIKVVTTVLQRGRPADGGAREPGDGAITSDRQRAGG
jgi:hypothetical protein